MFSASALIPFNIVIISVAKKSERIKHTRHSLSAAGVLNCCPLVVEVCVLLFWQEDDADLTSSAHHAGAFSSEEAATLVLLP